MNSNDNWCSRACLLLFVLAFSVTVSGHRAKAMSGFDQISVETSQEPVPTSISNFRDRLLSLESTGALTAGSGDPTAKAWVLSHVSPDFICERDFGGACAQESYLDRVRAFLFQTGQGAESLDASVQPGDPGSFPEDQLDTIAIGLEDLVGPMMQDGDDFCRAELLPIGGWSQISELESSLLADPDIGLSDELSASERIVGIAGTWNVRAAPDIAAPVVGRVSNEIVVYLDPHGERWTVQQSGDQIYRWARVGLPSGDEGYIASGPADTVSLLGARLCLGLHDGAPAITRHIGGGD